MNDSSAITDQAKIDADQETASDEIQTDASDGSDKNWPDEAKIVPDTYLGDESK